MGILLPTSVGGALVNMAASLSGRVVVNLNFTAGKAAMSSASAQAGVKTVVTSRAFIQKASLELPEGVEVIWIEDVRPTIRKIDRAAAPARWPAWPRSGCSRRPRGPGGGSR